MGTVDDLLLLAEIVEAGSLSAASRKTGVSKSTLSRRMDDLEKALGAHLLHRDPKRFSATEIGVSICQHALGIRQQFSAVTAIVEGHTRRPTGSIRIACPAVLGDLLVAEFAVAFAREHPDVRVTLDTSGGSFSTTIDHSDIIIQPAREALTNSDLVRRKLIVVPYGLVASPDLLKKLGVKVLAPTDLGKCPGLGWTADNFSSRWRLIDGRGKAAELDVNLVFNGSSLEVIRRAAISGLGLARLPLSMYEADLKSGRLVLPISTWSPPPVTIYALYSSRHSLTLAGKLFISGLTRHLRERLPEPQGAAGSKTVLGRLERSDRSRV
jgi:DNA-binding transcriptional LysR family regulator